MATSAQVIHSAPAPLEFTPGNALMVAVQSGRSIEEIKEFMALYREEETQKARRSFMSDKADAQRAMKSVRKTTPADFGETRSGKEGAKYNYSTLGNTGDEIRDVLHGHGFTYDWDAEQTEKDIIVTCILTHRDGFEKRVKLKSPADPSGGKSSVQAIGSTLTYLKRQTLEMAVGVTLVDDDDDGNQAPRFNTSSVKKPKPTPDEFFNLTLSVSRGQCTMDEALEYFTLNDEQIKTLETSLKK